MATIQVPAAVIEARVLVKAWDDFVAAIQSPEKSKAQADKPRRAKRRTYVKHPDGTARERIYAAMNGEAVSGSELCRQLNLTTGHFSVEVSHLITDGKVERVGRGVYRKVVAPADAATPPYAAGQ